MNKVKTQRDAKKLRDLRKRPAGTAETMNQRTPARTVNNVWHGRIVKGIRDIARIARQPWEEDVAQALRTLEIQRYQRANSYFDAIARAQNLVVDIRRRGAELQTTVEELQSTNEELEATNEELEATNEELEATSAELERTSAYLQGLMDGMLDLVIATDAAGVIIEVNQAAQALSGYDRDGLIGEKFEQFFTDPERARAALEEVLAEGKISDCELILATREGGEVPVSYNATVLRGADGEVTGILGSARDITERLLAEEELRQASLYNRSLIEASLDPLVTIDPEGRITDLNQATEQITGYAREELVGTEVSRYFTDPKRAQNGYEQAFREGAVQDFALEIRHRQGNNVPVLFNASVYRNQAGEVMGVFATARSISEVKRMTEELKRSNAELEQFAYVASHDLQEPLRKIESFGNLLQEEHGDKLGEEGGQYIAWMQEAAVRMRSLIDALLTYSRVTRSQDPFEPVDLAEVAAGVIGDLQVRLEETGGQVEVGDLPTLEAHPTQMRQLLQNLVGNALKFHREEEPPRVRISGRLLGPQESRPDGFAPGQELWEIAVEDNGIGFDEQYLEQIFAPFQRLHGRSEYEGSGIGLAVCRKIVVHHGGHLTARSTPGQGSRFIITLPVTIHPEEEIASGQE